jgi:hypothetical protein
MNSPQSSPKPDPNSRSRLVVVLPVLVICLAVIFFFARSFFKPSGDGTAPEAEANPGQNQSSVQSPGNQRAPTPLPSIKHLVRGRISLNGTPPPEKELPLDESCGQFYTNKPTTRFYAVDGRGGLGEVLVYVKAGLSGGEFAPPAQPALLEQVGCRYTPYVLGMQTGQKLLVRNSDPIPHNVHVTPSGTGNIESNISRPPQSADFAFFFESPEIFLRFKCDLHYWMAAYVAVLNHPFFAISGPDGSFTLTDVPSGKYTIEAYHRKAGKMAREITLGKNPTVILDFVLEVPATESP